MPELIGKPSVNCLIATCPVCHKHVAKSSWGCHMLSHVRKPGSKSSDRSKRPYFSREEIPAFYDAYYNTHPTTTNALAVTQEFDVSACKDVAVRKEDTPMFKELGEITKLTMNVNQVKPVAATEVPDEMQADMEKVLGQVKIKDIERKDLAYFIIDMFYEQIVAAGATDVKYEHNAFMFRKDDVITSVSVDSIVFKGLSRVLRSLKALD